MHSSSSQGHLERRLKNRHIQLIALGGTIGTGLFLGSAGIIELAGPSVLLGYATGGLIILFIIRFLGEMLVEGHGRARQPPDSGPEIRKEHALNPVTAALPMPR